MIIWLTRQSCSKLFFFEHNLCLHAMLQKNLFVRKSCAYIELWMHFASLESSSYASLVLSKLPMYIHNST